MKKVMYGDHDAKQLLREEKLLHDPHICTDLLIYYLSDAG